MKIIEDDIPQLYFNTKCMIQSISRKCNEKNRFSNPIKIKPQFVVPGYQIDEYYLLPEKLYVYKIFTTIDADYNNGDVLPKSKIIICTRRIEGSILLSQGIHINLENDHNTDYISMIKKPNLEKTIVIKDRRLRDGKEEKYTITKKAGRIDNEDLYTINYDVDTTSSNRENEQSNVFLQECLNRVIPNRGIEDLLSTIESQIVAIRSLNTKGGSRNNQQLKTLLKNIGEKLGDYINPSIGKL